MATEKRCVPNHVKPQDICLKFYPHIDSHLSKTVKKVDFLEVIETDVIKKTIDGPPLA